MFADDKYWTLVGWLCPQTRLFVEIMPPNSDICSRLRFQMPPKSNICSRLRNKCPQSPLFVFGSGSEQLHYKFNNNSGVILSLHRIMCKGSHFIVAALYGCVIKYIPLTPCSALHEHSFTKNPVRVLRGSPPEGFRMM